MTYRSLWIWGHKYQIYVCWNSFISVSIYFKIYMETDHSPINPLIVCLICLDFCICFVICHLWHVLFVYFYFKCSLKLKIDLVAVVKWVMNEGAEGSPKHRLSSFPTQLFYLPGFFSRNTPVQIIIEQKILIYLCLFHPFCGVKGAE